MIRARYRQLALAQPVLSGVVDAPIRHPTDSRLLEDAVRVLGRHARRIVAAGVEVVRPLRNRHRSVQRRIREIASILLQRGEEARQALKRPYRDLLAVTRRTIRDAHDTLVRAKKKLSKLSEEAKPRVEHSIRTLETFIPRALSVVRQTRARIIRGITNSKDKLIRMFEPYAQILGRGKPHKPTEFGMLVKIQEAGGLGGRSSSRARRRLTKTATATTTARPHL